MPERSSSAVLVAAALLLGGTPAIGAGDAIGSSEESKPGPSQATTLPGISGLAPLGPGMALAVHDATSPDEDDRPRASVMTLTDSPAGVTWQPLRFEWPGDAGPASDLESASGIPGSSLVLLGESGDDGSGFGRLFLVDIDIAAAAGPTATIAGVTEWPKPVFNVEAIAVGEAGGELVLVYAERAQGEPVTTIEAAPLTLDPFEIGEPVGVEFTSPAVLSQNDRPVSAMEIGSAGIIHVASAYDTGDGAGPFSGSVWAIGALVGGDDGPRVELMPDPAIVAFADGFKIESLAVLERADGSTALFLGTDDEDYGGVLRPLPTQ